MTPRRHLFRSIIASCICMMWVCPVSYAFQNSQFMDSGAVEDAGALPDAPSAPNEVTVKQLPIAILKDQIPIWTSPIRVRPHDLIWLLPLGAATGITLSTDTDAMRNLSRDPTF